MYFFQRLPDFIKLISILLITTTTLLNTGCATMLEGSKQETRIHCEPSNNVTAVVDGEEILLENGIIILDKKRETHFVTLKKEGYLSSTLAFTGE